ncbi:M48 family metallopeptidase [Roseibium salinum]|uniref:SprT family zinc-dependent metalloprotease n=1 Tax=Roseibium salinum TaxID=1604349 RepID=A0ABT3R6G3_9HYPH|nr:SprT family zinc-dependent metalloprotease [Roseibium sp. DSM 29163]MCX2724759.1 SprT family zinc-dependent metalloprotease [Roseibium sp. DSM 29163]MDN3721258.1 SprT family zinc-dependent metalloprotease [Roseibium salinum]
MLLRRRKTHLPDHIEIQTDTRAVRIRLRANPRAQRYLLRLPADMSGPVLTVPHGGNLERAERFARQHIGWLIERLQDRPDHVAFRPGDTIPLRGEDHIIIPTGKLRGLVTVGRSEDGLPALFVPGAEDHVPRKVTSWLKDQARADLSGRAGLHAKTIGRKIAAISIRDTKSRWGSCASNGRLSFSWRLVLAPSDILDYVAAHEVAHLKEMNHSARFWRLCEQLAPQTPRARLWLKENGLQLHGYG